MACESQARLDRLQIALRESLANVPEGFLEATLERMVDALASRLGDEDPPAPKGDHVSPPGCPCASEGCKIARVRAVLAAYQAEGAPHETYLAETLFKRVAEAIGYSTR